MPGDSSSDPGCMLLDDQVVEQGAAGVLLMGNIRVRCLVFMQGNGVGVCLLIDSGPCWGIKRSPATSTLLCTCSAPLLNPVAYTHPQMRATAVPVYRPTGPCMLATAVNAGNVLELDGWPAGQQVGWRLAGCRHTCCIKMASH